VATAPDVNTARFAKWVARVLDSAHRRNMTDQDIRKATGVGTSTFHRWKSPNAPLPKVDKVRAFALGLGESVDDATAALGIRTGRDNPEPEPPLPPEVRIILRKLSDPHTSAQDRLVIREMLRMLARQAGATDRELDDDREAAS